LLKSVRKEKGEKERGREIREKEKAIHG